MVGRNPPSSIPNGMVASLILLSCAMQAYAVKQESHLLRRSQLWTDNIGGGNHGSLPAIYNAGTLQCGQASRRCLQQLASPPPQPGYTVTCWGYIGKEPIIQRYGYVAAVSGGYAHALLLDTQGIVKAIGNGNAAQSNFLNVPLAAQIAQSTKAVAAGEWHSLALLQNGTVVAWGDNSTGQLNVPPAAQSGVISISARGNWSMAVLSAAPWVVAWGQHDANQTVIPAAAQSQNIKSISAGALHGMALLNDGTVISWGDNHWNQSTTPAGIQGNVTEISAGGFFSLFLLKNGTVVSVGDNSLGQQIVPPMAKSHVKSVKAGWQFAIALLDNGQVVHWGEDDVGNKNQGLLPAQALSGVVAIEAGYDTGFAFRPQDLSPVLGYDLYSYGGDAQRGILRNVISVAAGSEHGLAIMVDGSIQAWGYTDVASPDTVVPTQAIDVAAAVMVAGGGSHSLALLENGTVVAWGGAYDMSTDVPPQLQTNTPTSCVAVAAGDFHSMALISNGSVVAWQPPTGILTLPPAVIQGRARAISVTKDQNAVLLTNDTLVAWKVSNVDAPVGQSLVTRFGVAAASAGVDHVLVLYLNGTVEDIATGNTNFTVPSTAQSGVHAISAGEHSLVLKHDGSVIAWMPPDSDSSHTQLVIQQSQQNTAQQFVGIASGWYTAIGIIPSQPLPPEPAPISAPPSPLARPLNGFGANVSAWGANITQNGANFLTNVVMVAAGENHGLALLTNGNITSWGADDQQQGDVPPDIIGKVTSLAAGSNFSVALLNDGTVRAWGSPNDGLSRAAVPADLTDGSMKAIAVAAGLTFGAALLDTGKVVPWGASGYGATIIPDEAQSGVTTISAGRDHVLALKGDQVIAWGADIEGEATVPFEATTNVQAVAAGSYHSLALLNTGKVVAWGANLQGQCNVPPTALSNVVAIAAGEQHSLALLADGTVVQWGDTTMGQGAPPIGLSGVTRIAAGLFTSYALQDPPIPRTPSASDAASHKASFKPGTIAGVSVAAAFVIAAIVAVWVYFKRRRLTTTLTTKHLPANAGVTVHVDISKPDDQVLKHAMDIPGLMKGEPFTRATAHAYRWTAVDEKQRERMVSVEAGVNDTQLDNMAGNAIAAPAVHLTKQQLQQQIKLLSDGLLGRGATALVFKCLWSSRFGPNAMLAIKVLKDGYEPDILVLQSFTYEANVLASLMPPHPNVVRLYGYCLEPPTVCLILELLPYTLKDMLYKQPNAKPLATQVLKSSGYGSSTAFTQELKPKAAANTASENELLTGSSSSLPSSQHMLITSSTGINLGGQVKTKLTMGQVLKISLEIAAGLKYLHATPVSDEMAAVIEEPLQGIDEATSNATKTATMTNISCGKSTKVVHRDLKPANILINSRDTAKISDFGLARPQQRTTIQTDNIGAGTLPYMAPELLVGNQVARALMATNRVDIYSTAMIMWEMLAGHAPWNHVSEAALAAAVLGGKRPMLPHQVDDNEEGKAAADTALPILERHATLKTLPEFNSIIRACWQQREHKRPTAQALYDMLGTLMQKINNNQVL